MCQIIAISGNGIKVPVLSDLTKHDATKLRHHLLQADDNFDMLGVQICKYRIRK